MKIVLFDPYNGKFTDDIIAWWTKQGHEVIREIYYNPDLVDWADIVWFDCADNNLLSAMQPDLALKDQWAYETKKGKWDMHDIDLTGKKVIVRAIDIEIWTGSHANEIWDLVTDVIFLSPHIQEIMMADSRPQQGHFKQHVIPCGVNLDRWTFKEHEKGFNIGVVSELWESKGVDLALQVSLKLKQIDECYNIEWIGPQQMYHWGKAYFDDFVEHNKLPFKYSSDRVEDLNAWWEDKNYILHCSVKEAYSYATAEAMAKGIKPVTHRFFGADNIWPGITWSSIDEAVEMITEDKYDSASYRQYLIDHKLDLDSMMKAIDEVITA